MPGKGVAQPLCWVGCGSLCQLMLTHTPTLYPGEYLKPLQNPTQAYVTTLQHLHVQCQLNNLIMALGIMNFNSMCMDEICMALGPDVMIALAASNKTC